MNNVNISDPWMDINYDPDMDLDYLNGTASEFPFLNTTDTTVSNATGSLSVTYVLCEVLVGITAVIGNALTILVFVLDRRLRRLTNYYIVSLAMADLLVGFPGIPFAILTYMGIPRNPYMCLPMLSLLLILCTVSIFCLVAVSVDRYWAILYPLRYSRVMTAKIARRIIMMCWFFGTCFGVLPMMGWRKEHDGDCLFVMVMDYNYLVFLYFSTIVGPGLLMAFFYTHIYTVVLKQTKFSIKSEHGTLRQIAAQEPQSECQSLSGGSQRQRPHFLSSRNQSRSSAEVNRCDSRRHSTSTNIVHQVTHPSRREVKAAKSLSIIVLFFLICWFPLYTINCLEAFCGPLALHPKVMDVTIILTHVNSAVNPFLYAYHMKDFRLALKTFILQRILRRRSPSDQFYSRSFVSPHHSTLHRIGAPGGGSPQLATFHTPHAPNTPITSSPSLIAGAPGGIRSRSSTLDSHGPWSPAPDTSQNPSHFKSMDRPLDAISRPRAATINTHSAPAYTQKNKEAGSNLLKPLLSASHATILEDNHQNKFSADQTHFVFKKDSYNIHSSDRISSKSDKSETDSSAHATGITSSFDRRSVISASHSSLEVIKEDNSPFPDSKENEGNSNTDILSSKKSNIGMEKVDHYMAGKDSITNSTKDPYPSRYSDNLEKDDQGIKTINSETKSTDLESHSLIKIQLDTSERENQNQRHSSSRINNGTSFDDPDTLTASYLPNGKDEIRSNSINESDIPLSIDAIDINTKPLSDSGGIEDSDKTSHLPPDFYKFIPKIFRKREENKKTKSQKTIGKSWFSNLIRHRSYHGITMDVVGSKQLPRAQSISGPMET